MDILPVTYIFLACELAPTSYCSAACKCKRNQESELSELHALMRSSTSMCCEGHHRGFSLSGTLATQALTVVVDKIVSRVSIRSPAQMLLLLAAPLEHEVCRPEFKQQCNTRGEVWCQVSSSLGIALFLQCCYCSACFVFLLLVSASDCNRDAISW